MTKLIKRTVFPEHTKLLQGRQDELLGLLKALTEEGKERAEEEWEKAVVAWGRCLSRMHKRIWVEWCLWFHLV